MTFRYLTGQVFFAFSAKKYKTVKNREDILGAQEENLKADIQKIERALSYYKGLSDEVAGHNIMVDTQVILLKRDLEQKKIGYDILKRLHDIIGAQFNLDDFHNSTLQLILTRLKMDRAVVLWRDKTNSFFVNYYLGYTKEESRKNLKQPFDFSLINALEDPHLLFNKTTKKEEHHLELCERLLLPYLVGTPIKTRAGIEGWLIAGREKEARPFYPPLLPGDLELFDVMGGFIKAAVSNFHLYANLERANQKLDNYNKELEAKVFERTRDIENSRHELEKEKVKSDRLLLNILPLQIANELKENGQSNAQSLTNVTIVFTDFVNFTQYAQNMEAQELVSRLQDCFTKFDRIIEKYDLEKIKTIGDAYMAAGGMEGNTKEACINIVKAAIEMQAYVKSKGGESGAEDAFYRMRVGINTGDVVAGIVGLTKFQYDIWGDTVNTASRMESYSQMEKVNISTSTYDIIKDCDEFEFEYRGKILVKGKGEIGMYFVYSRI